MKTMLIVLLSLFIYSFNAFSQCSNPYAGQDTATCGYTYTLSVENATTGYWTAYLGEEEMMPAPDYVP
ncbi:MAG: hypothetical protein C0596_02330 [Marinilabiliales bacterium]|nr:MAG: hypothetical protein C0596_02330 [Marinilabiliales bacterium]